MCALMLLVHAAAAMTCTLIEVTPLRFGRYDALTPLDAVGTMLVECRHIAPGETLRIELDARSGDPLRRRLDQAGLPGGLRYQLYLDPARQRVWGRGGRAWHLPALGRRRWRGVVPIYGVIPKGQDVAPGRYGDTVAIELVY